MAEQPLATFRDEVPKTLTIFERKARFDRTSPAGAGGAPRSGNQKSKSGRDLLDFVSFFDRFLLDFEAAGNNFLIEIERLCDQSFHDMGHKRISQKCIKTCGFLTQIGYRG